MTDEVISAKLSELDAREKSNSHRLDRVEQEQRSLLDLAKSVAVLADAQHRLTKDMGQIRSDIQELRAVPAKRWEQVVDKLVFGVLGSGLGVLLAMLIGRITG